MSRLWDWRPCVWSREIARNNAEPKFDACPQPRRDLFRLGKVLSLAVARHSCRMRGFRTPAMPDLTLPAEEETLASKNNGNADEARIYHQQVGLGLHDEQRA